MRSRSMLSSGSLGSNRGAGGGRSWSLGLFRHGAGAGFRAGKSRLRLGKRRPQALLVHGRQSAVKSTKHGARRDSNNLNIICTAEPEKSANFLFGKFEAAPLELQSVGLDAVEVAREGHHDAVDQQAAVDGELRGDMRQYVAVVQNHRKRYPGDQQEAREKAAEVHHVARGAQLRVVQVRVVLGGVVPCDQNRDVRNGKHESVQNR
ncbi:hypothetical protein KL939_003756 [Ogataea angusta]|nr:hypothetical protein KL939_003756 [Ogataea angusta]